MAPVRSRRPEVSFALQISVQKVKSHAAEILRKLGLRDRIQVVVFAYEKRLVFPAD